MLPEKRLAWDSGAYSYDQFIEYYGDVHGKTLWAGAASTANDPYMLSEKRLAWDNGAYNYDQFIEYYGHVHGKTLWAGAACTANDAQVVPTEYNAPIAAGDPSTAVAEHDRDGITATLSPPGPAALQTAFQFAATEHSIAVPNAAAEEQNSANTEHGPVSLPGSSQTVATEHSFAPPTVATGQHSSDTTEPELAGLQGSSLISAPDHDLSTAIAAQANAVDSTEDIATELRVLEGWVYSYETMAACFNNDAPCLWKKAIPIVLQQWPTPQEQIHATEQDLMQPRGSTSAARSSSAAKTFCC